MKNLFSHMVVVCSVVLFCSACGQKRFEIIDTECGSCHKLEIVYDKKRPMQEWKRIMHGMKMRGMAVSSEEEKKIMNILQQHFTP